MVENTSFDFFDVSCLRAVLMKMGDLVMRKPNYWSEGLPATDDVGLVVESPERRLNGSILVSWSKFGMRWENPMDLEGWKLLARTCLMTGHIQKAEVHYTKALKYFPSNESLIYEYAVLKKNTDQNFFYIMVT